MHRIKKISFEEMYQLEFIHDKWIDIKHREIWIQGTDTDTTYSDGEEPGIEYMMATRVIKNLHILKAMSAKDPVMIHLHTNGGVTEEGLAIYDTLRAMPYKTKMISYTHARSMSSIILQAADERLLLPNSYFLFHEGTIYVGGTPKVVKSYVEYSKIQEKIMNDIYATRLSKKGKFKGKTVAEITKILKSYMDKKEDVYLTAKEAIEWGFADGILKKF